MTDVWNELKEDSILQAFDRWGQNKDNHAGDYYYFVKDVENDFKPQPEMAVALLIQTKYTGLPSRGNESLTGIGVTFPSDILTEVDTKVHENQVRREDGTLANYDDKDENGDKPLGGAEGLGRVPVPTDAFDRAVTWARQKVSDLWDAYCDDMDSFEEQALAYDPTTSYNPSGANEAALKDTEDKEQVRYVQVGGFLLIGEAHDAEALQWARDHATSLGNIEVTKGTGFLSAGGLKVWGCVAADRDGFKAEIAKFSKKKPTFV